MNKQMKQYLETVVNSIVNEDTDAAEAAFHDYLRAKTQSILMNEAEDEDCEDEEDKEVDKDLDKVEKDVKKAKKDQKKDVEEDEKEEKKDKKEDKDEEDED